ncbi:unnamed protein product [Adineta steineri]|uniref:Uncharacterized protein n=1 Tax=Adineta steineri TaxID=433720 RepID=A0A814XDH1_9BILA|nr:unnamed protein product [Adineta steineri]CAF1209733.1 unnamed protein product [Adineta steineri]
MENIHAFLLRKPEIGSVPFKIEIRDQEGDFVTFDDDYKEEYNTFNTENTDKTTVEPTNSLDRTVILRVTLLDRKHYASRDVQPKEISNENSRTVDNINEQQQTIDHDEPIQKTPEHPSFLLSNDPKMGFIKDRNVEKKQRDQYSSNQTSVRTGEKTGSLTMIQAPKKPEDKYNSVLPRFIIRRDDIKSMGNHVWTLLVFIVLDVYQGGIRSLCKHPERIFVDQNNVTQRWNPYEIPITTDSWTHKEGIELKLTAVAIEGAKTHPDAVRDIICYLEDPDKNELSNISPDSEKSRLALVLRKDNEILWDTLVLSDAMIFEKKNNKSSTKSTSNVVTNTEAEAEAALKRKGPTESGIQSFPLPY